MPNMLDKPLVQLSDKAVSKRRRERVEALGEGNQAKITKTWTAGLMNLDYSL